MTSPALLGRDADGCSSLAGHPGAVTPPSRPRHGSFLAQTSPACSNAALAQELFLGGMRMGFIKVGAGRARTSPPGTHGKARGGHSAPWKNACGLEKWGINTWSPARAIVLFAKGKLRHAAAQRPPWGSGGGRACRNAGQICKEGKPYKTGKAKAAEASLWEEVMLLGQPSCPPASGLFCPPGSHRGLFLSWGKKKKKNFLIFFCSQRIRGSSQIPAVLKPAQRKAHLGPELCLTAKI